MVIWSLRVIHHSRTYQMESFKWKTSQRCRTATVQQILATSSSSSFSPKTRIWKRRSTASQHNSKAMLVSMSKCGTNGLLRLSNSKKKSRCCRRALMLAILQQPSTRLTSPIQIKSTTREHPSPTCPTNEQSSHFWPNLITIFNIPT